MQIFICYYTARSGKYPYFKWAKKFFLATDESYYGLATLLLSAVPEGSVDWEQEDWPEGGQRYSTQIRMGIPCCAKEDPPSSEGSTQT